MTPRERTLLSLRGLSVGEAFGENFFFAPEAVVTYALPPGPWRWTDDTHTALSIVEILLSHGGIDQDQLAQAFARRYGEAPWRGYAGGARRLLQRLRGGGDWRVEAPRLFGQGSYGNGAAMRVAPIGAWFSGQPERAAVEAGKSAVVTHAHPEGRAGAVAVAVAAALMAEYPQLGRQAFLQAIIALTPPGLTQDRLRLALTIEPAAWQRAVEELGTGQQVATFDTVLFCLWVCATVGSDYEAALWLTAAGSGDVDTTCAIVGGILGAAAVTIPPAWLAAREPLPPEFEITAPSGRVIA
ncbi:MAG: ADP-ribosylglycohydrolase family protein [Candidatus Competibacteraceae bacterium]